MKQNAKRFLMVMMVVMAAFMTGCTTRLTDFTVITTKNIDLSRIGELSRGTQRVRGEDTMYMILFIPTKLQPNMKDAIDRAIQSVPGGVALVDGVLYIEQAFFILGGYTSYIVEGTPLIDPKLRSQLPSHYIIVSYNEKDKEFVPAYVSKEEYEKAKVGIVPTSSGLQNLN